MQLAFQVPGPTPVLSGFRGARGARPCSRHQPRRVASSILAVVINAYSALEQAHPTKAACRPWCQGCPRFEIDRPAEPSSGLLERLYPLTMITPVWSSGYWPGHPASTNSPTCVVRSSEGYVYITVPLRHGSLIATFNEGTAVTTKYSAGSVWVAADDATVTTPPGAGDIGVLGSIVDGTTLAQSGTLAPPLP